MRQVADSGKYLVVPLRAHGNQAGAALSPGRLDQCAHLRTSLGQRGEHHQPIPIQLRAGRLRARALCARDRVSRHELRQSGTQHPARSFDDVLLCAAPVGDRTTVREMRRDLGEHSPGLPHRDGHEHQIGIGDCGSRILGNLVDEPQLRGAREVGATAAYANYMSHSARLLQGCRKRAADQADTEDCKFADREE